MELKNAGLLILSNEFFKSYVLRFHICFKLYFINSASGKVNSFQKQLTNKQIKLN